MRIHKLKEKQAALIKTMYFIQVDLDVINSWFRNNRELTDYFRGFILGEMGRDCITLNKEIGKQVVELQRNFLEKKLATLLDQITVLQTEIQIQEKLNQC